MIQRIQTVFLLAAFVFTVLLFFVPFTSLISDLVYNFSLNGITSTKVAEQIQQPVWLTLFGLVNSLIILVTIFLFKNRRLQMKLTLLATLLSFGLNAAMYFLTDRYHTLLSAEVNYKISFIFPLIAAILLFLAYRSIRKDENLIRSLDRLR